MFNTQLLSSEIPRAEKVESSYQSFLRFQDLRVKKLLEDVDEIDPRRG